MGQAVDGWLGDALDVAQRFAVPLGTSFPQPLSTIRRVSNCGRSTQRRSNRHERRNHFIEAVRVLDQREN